MTIYKLLGLSIFLSIPASLLAEPLKPFAEMDTFLLSEPIAIDAADNQWQGNYQPNGDKQIASLWLETGVKKSDWSLGLLYREEYLLNFHSDTADLYYTVENGADLTTDRRYKIDLDAYRFRGIGARYSRNYKFKKNLNFTAGTSLFVASNLLDGSLSGSALANSTDDYEYYISGDYLYSEDMLFERKNIDKPTGIGLTLDLDINWKPSSKWHLNANIRDLAGSIFWKDVPYTEATANSDNTVINESGFTQVNPILSGFEGYEKSHTQKLVPSANLRVDYQLNQSDTTASLKYKHRKDLNLFALGGSKSFAKGELSVHYWPQIETLEADFQGDKFGFSLGLDDLDISEARTFWLSLKYR